MRRVSAGVALALMLLCRPAMGETAAVTIDGLVAHPLHLTAADLAQFPATELDTAFQTGHGTEKAHYRGVRLWSVLEKAGLATGSADKRDKLRHYLRITGRDGYAVVIAIGEIDPDFENKPVILAYRRDGKPLGPDSLRVLVPGDRHGGRAVRDVTRIDLE